MRIPSQSSCLPGLHGPGEPGISAGPWPRCSPSCRNAPGKAFPSWIRIRAAGRARSSPPGTGGHSPPGRPVGSLRRLRAPGCAPGRGTRPGQGSLEAPDLPLLYWHRVQAALPVPCFTDADEAGTGWKPQGTGFWRVTRSGPEALIPPAGEYSPIPKSGVIRIPEPSNPRWPTALALAIVYALKLALRRTLFRARIGRAGPRGSRRVPGAHPSARNRSRKEALRSRTDSVMDTL
ncbi:MAG: hypothetical protein M0C28_43570 [Candidatus Moduliflexus flocculans]|nr:hypothetical protein [Candidatus Moduliflexus flocculans]